MNFYIQSYKRKSAIAAAKPIESSKVEELATGKQSEESTTEVNNNSVESIESLEKADKSLPLSSGGAEELCSSESASASAEETTTVAENVSTTYSGDVLPKDVIEPTEGLRQRIVTLEQLQLQDHPSRVEELVD